MKHSLVAYKNRLEQAAVGVAGEFLWGYIDDVNKLLDKNKYPKIIAIWPEWKLSEDDYIDVEQTLLFGGKGESEIIAIDDLQDVAEKYITNIDFGQYYVANINLPKLIKLHPKGLTADSSSWIRVDVKIRAYCDASPIAKMSGYGYLYNEAAISSPLFAPAGWKVLSNNDLTELLAALPVGAKSAALKLFDFNYWGNDSVFIYDEHSWQKIKALATGKRNPNGSFYGQGIAGYYALFDGATVSAAIIEKGIGATIMTESEAGAGYAVRMIYDGKDDPGEYMTDFDGNRYNIVEIGGKYYIDADYRCTTDAGMRKIHFATSDEDWILYSTDPTTDLAYCKYV